MFCWEALSRQNEGRVWEWNCLREGSGLKNLMTERTFGRTDHICLRSEHMSVQHQVIWPTVMTLQWTLLEVRPLIESSCHGVNSLRAVERSTSSTCSKASAHTTIRSTYALMQHQSGTSRRTRVAFSKNASVTMMSSVVGMTSVLTLRWNSA